MLSAIWGEKHMFTATVLTVLKFHVFLELASFLGASQALSQASRYPVCKYCFYKSVIPHDATDRRNMCLVRKSYLAFDLMFVKTRTPKLQSAHFRNIAPWSHNLPPEVANVVSPFTEV
jgi:predicted patatin/cPLA2 family phospholipase